ncbi:MAG: hypothetical protein WD530_07965 [Vicingaceae bacterium]
MRKCKICKKELKGRADKLFCSIECKNYYHVGLRKVTNKAAKIIDKTLHRNHSIILEILGKNSSQKKIKRTVLTNKKFNFKYHTHFNINSKGKTYYFLYDIAWMEFSDDEVLIVRKR